MFHNVDIPAKDAAACVIVAFMFRPNLSSNHIRDILHLPKQSCIDDFGAPTVDCLSSALRMFHAWPCSALFSLHSEQLGETIQCSLRGCLVVTALQKGFSTA